MTMHSAGIGKSLASGLLCLLLGIAANAQAAQAPIVDLNTNDLNDITDFQVGPNGLTVWEDYNEATLVRYPSHDGWAIVNPNFGWFDKLVTFQPGAAPIVGFDFIVLNTGPHTWSDYHFEFWDAGFTHRVGMFVEPLSVGSSVFANNSGGGMVLGVDFWAPGWQPPGTTERFSFQANLAGVDPTIGFGIRQIATTVPEPETYAMLLAGLGLLGLAARRRKQNQAA